MVEVEMSEDIRKFENKLVGGLTKRQLISVAIGVGLGAPLGIFVPGDITIKVLLVALVALPALLCGWVKLDGMPLEILAVRAVYSNILCPRKRKLKTSPAASGERPSISNFAPWNGSSTSSSG